MKRPLYLAAALAAAGAVMAATACGGATSTPTASPGTSSRPPAHEANPAGDIPDNQAFVDYTAPGARFAVKVPEGWARTTQGTATVFTDKLNTIRIDSTAAAAAPTVQSASADTVQVLRASTPGFQAGDVRGVSRAAGDAILITYRADSPPDPVTGKTVVDDVEQYLFFHNGTLVTLTLSGPQGADNVDPWRIVTDSLRWTR